MLVILCTKTETPSVQVVVDLLRTCLYNMSTFDNKWKQWSLSNDDHARTCSQLTAVGQFCRVLSISTDGACCVVNWHPSWREARCGRLGMRSVARSISFSRYTCFSNCGSMRFLKMTNGDTSVFLLTCFYALL